MNTGGIKDRKLITSEVVGNNQIEVLHGPLGFSVIVSDPFGAHSTSFKGERWAEALAFFDATLERWREEEKNGKLSP